MLHEPGIHGSSHILIFCPSPTLEMHPCFRVFTPAIILCQVREAPIFNLALSESPSGKYSAFRTVPHKEYGLSINLHAYFARRAKLKQWMSLNSIPPLHFSTHNFHHAIQCILFWLSLSPCATDLRRISLPPNDNCLSFQPFTLCMTRSIKY